MRQRTSDKLDNGNAYVDSNWKLISDKIEKMSIVFLLFQPTNQNSYDASSIVSLGPDIQDSVLIHAVHGGCLVVSRVTLFFIARRSIVS